VEIALDDIDNLKTDGINIVAIGIEICLDDTIVICESEDDIKKAINIFHGNGIKTLLVLNPAHPEFGIDPFSAEASGKSLLDKLTPLVLQWAAICETYGVELFAPVNEPQLLAYQREEDVSAWAQEVLPQIRKLYQGKLAFVVQGYAEGLYRYDLSGYDYVAYGGLTCTSDIEAHPDWIGTMIQEAFGDLKAAYAEHRYLLFGYGAFTGPDYYSWEPIAPDNMAKHMPDLPADFFIVSEKGQAAFHDLLFEMTWEEVEGYFIAVFRGWEYRDKPAENAIRTWFAP
jgi:hypothetical protein